LLAFKYGNKLLKSIQLLLIISPRGAFNLREKNG
jgi:hypothetical protein